MTDEQIMREAIKLALKGHERVAPNPNVGAIIIKDGEIIGKGRHEEFGGPHAEVNAINDAGDADLEGATMYVTLEPCSHQGKTPPCAPLLVEKKFAKVVIGMIDPNPEVSGRGINILEESGIEVKTGVLETECKWSNRFFIKHITTGLPYIIGKIAQSMDGCIATSTGNSQWISGEESRRRAHILRAEVGAVLIGKNTAKHDDPRLTVRHAKGTDPQRIVFDTGLSLPFTLGMFNDPYRKKTFICYNPDKATKTKASNLKLAGLNLIPFQYDDDKLNLSESLKHIAEHLHINSIMVEGGAGIFSSFAEANLFDELHFFVAPKIIGNGLSSFSSFKTRKMESAINFKILNISQSGDDVHIVGVK